MVEVTQADEKAAIAIALDERWPDIDVLVHGLAAQRMLGRRQMREEAAQVALMSSAPSGWIGGILVSAIRWRTSIGATIRAIPIGDE